MMTAERGCPVCEGRSSSRKFVARDAHYGIPGEWWVRECRSCESLFLEEPPPQDTLTALYAPDYYAYAIRTTSTLKRALQRAVFYSRATGDPAFASPGRLLDFGCGAGEFLLEMKARGWDCAGVEINEATRAHARNCGLDIRPALVGSEGFDTGTFDYVRANHSLEHVLCPRETLRQMFELLKPGGTLFIGVPTASGENARLFGACWWHVSAPLHAFVPSTDGLVRLVERTGFRVTRLSNNGDFAGTAGSLQIVLNRGTSRRSAQGLLFALKPLLVLGHWYARLQDLRGVGDKLELIAEKPRASPAPA